MDRAEAALVKVFLVRHGETTYGAESRYSGQSDAPLTPRGEAQHLRLRDVLHAEKIDRVVSSDLTRCRVLADLVSADHDLAATTDARLREASFGRWEGLTYEEARTRDRAAMTAFNRAPADAAPPGGESLATLVERARPFFDVLVKEHKDREGALLVVAHAGLLRGLLCALLLIPLERYWTLNVDNAALTTLDVYRMGAIVQTLNDTHHLRDLS